MRCKQLLLAGISCSADEVGLSLFNLGLQLPGAAEKLIHQIDPALGGEGGTTRQSPEEVAEKEGTDQ